MPHELDLSNLRKVDSVIGEDIDQKNGKYNIGIVLATENTDEGAIVYFYGGRRRPMVDGSCWYILEATRDISNRVGIGDLVTLGDSPGTIAEVTRMKEIESVGVHITLEPEDLKNIIGFVPRY